MLWDLTCVGDSHYTTQISVQSNRVIALSPELFTTETHADHEIQRASRQQSSKALVTNKRDGRIGIQVCRDPDKSI